MVGFGRSLEKARRRKWEKAYLDYNGLKEIVEEIEASLTSRSSARFEEQFSILHSRAADGNDKNELIPALKEKFFTALKLEIEKLSLFTLQQQGQLADAVGALRFESESSAPKYIFDAKSPLLQKRKKAAASPRIGSTSVKSSNTIFDPKSPLLETTTDDDGYIALTSADNKLDQYAVLGVELLHLLKFICINSIAVGKILKKYNKVHEKLDEPPQYIVTGEHLQQLAFSPSVRAIESSLKSALVEFFAQLPSSMTPSQTVDAILRVNRFQCVMSCSDRLRRNAEILQRPFWDFLSLQSMIMTGSNLGGMGDSGRKALDWLIRLRPDKLLSMTEEELERLWSGWSGGPTAVLEHTKHRIRESMQGLGDIEEEMSVAGKGEIGLLVDSNKWKWGGVDSKSMTLNLLSTLLYTVNYYIVAPTANHYAIMLGTDGAYGSTLIGASSFSAIFAAFFYSFWYTKSSFKSALMFSAFCPLVGNLIYALAISYKSMGMAIVGRILCGFGSAEVVNRQLISACVDFEGITKASALFVAAGAIGMSVGPLLAAILDMTAGRDARVDIHVPFSPAGGVIFDHVTSPGFFMSGLWLLELLALLFLFQEPKRINAAGGDDNTESQFSDSFVMNDTGDETSDDDSPLVRQRGSGYGAIEGMDGLATKSTSWLEEAAITTKLIFQNPGLPVTVLLFGYIEAADEVLISSCSMVCKRYFGWHGSVAGLLIASLGALVLPAHFVVEKASHYYSERRILSKSLVFILISTLGILNWSGMEFDIEGIADYKADHKPEHTQIGNQEVASLLTDKGEFPYDYGSGPAVYIVFLSAIFMGTIVLEGVDTSIMAKVTPSELNDRFVNCGLLATLVGTLGRVVADGTITLSALLDIHVFVDFVNATFFPVLVLTLAGLFLARKYYKKLV